MAGQGQRASAQGIRRLPVGATQVAGTGPSGRALARGRRRARRAGLAGLLLWATSVCATSAAALPPTPAPEGTGLLAGPGWLREPGWDDTHGGGPRVRRAFEAWEPFVTPPVRLGLDEYRPWMPAVSLLESAPGWGHGERALAFGEPAPARRLPAWAPALMMAGALAASEFAADGFADGGVRFESGMDRRVRTRLASGSRGGRRAAAVASDVLLGGLGAALVVDWMWLRDEHGGLESVGADGSYLMANLMSVQVAKRGVERERPYGTGCRSDRDYVSGCDDRLDSHASFYSGHASTSGTLAGLICARHLGRSERTWRDPATCGGAVATSLATGMLRIAAEKHFATDVLVGWAAGAVFGYVLPSRFVYGGAPPERWSPQISPVVGARTVGVQYRVPF